MDGGSERRTFVHGTHGPRPPDSCVTVRSGARSSRAYARSLRSAASPKRCGGEALLATVPENRDVLYLRGDRQRHLGDIPAALATLARSSSCIPASAACTRSAATATWRCGRRPRRSTPSCRRCNINPALPASWSMLEGLYRMTGRGATPAMAAAHVATLASCRAEVVTATALFADGDLAAAEQLVRAFLLKHGDHIEAMRLLARIGMERDVLDDARAAARGRARSSPPTTMPRATTMRRCWLKRHKHARGTEQAQQLLAAEPANRNYRTLLRDACVGLGEHEQAMELYRELLDRRAAAGGAAPVDRALAEDARPAREAIEAYRAAAAAAPEFGDAYWSLANLKTYRFTDAEIGADARRGSAPRPRAVDRYHLCFALGKALEDRGEYAESFALLRARQRAQARREPLPARVHRAQHARCRSRSARASSSRARAGSGLPEPAIRFSSSVCRAPARR